MRIALYEACEIVRLCEDSGSAERKAVERIRNKLLEFTQAEHNLLPHETPDEKKSSIERKKMPPLLPRYDVL